MRTWTALSLALVVPASLAGTLAFGIASRRGPAKTPPLAQSREVARSPEKTPQEAKPEAELPTMAPVRTPAPTAAPVVPDNRDLEAAKTQFLLLDLQTQRAALDAAALAKRGRDLQWLNAHQIDLLRNIALFRHLVVDYDAEALRHARKSPVFLQAALDIIAEDSGRPKVRFPDQR